MINQSQVLEFIKKNNLAVLSTVSPQNTSESAVMAITVKDDLTIFMSTESGTRKVANLMTNPHTSLIIGGLNNDPSVQLDGQSTILDNQSSQAARDFMLSVHPELKDYLSLTCKIIAFRPTWIRYSDFSQNPPTIEEINL